MLYTGAVAGVSSAPSGAPSASTPAFDAKLHASAKKFESMFMSEMLHFARPANKVAGVFSEGIGEKSWNMMMDQALGQAAVQGNTRLGSQIEQAMRKAQNGANEGAK